MSQLGQSRRFGDVGFTCACPPKADMRREVRQVRFVPILLQKSKIRRRQKSRESRFRDIAVAARLRGADTKVRGRFGVKRYGPSHREARDASASLRISVHHPKNTFATKSAKRRHSPTYSITSSARASNVGGMVRPSALAVLRLIFISNFVGCSTGSSAGSAPLIILSA